MLNQLFWGILLACALLASARDVGQDLTEPFIVNGEHVEGDGQPASGALPKRIMQEIKASNVSSNVSSCIWDGSTCAVGGYFIAGLPSLLGSPTTDSARILANAAARSTVCANILTQPECLAAASYSCNWNSIANTCNLADLLDADALRGVAYCPGSRVDAAMACAALTNGSAAACTGSPYNCSVLWGSSLGGWTSSLGDMQFGLVTGMMLEMMVRYGIATAADPATSAILSLLGLAAGAANDTKICAPRWMQDGTLMGALSTDLTQAITAGRDILSSLLTPDLLGSCNGTKPFRDALAFCPRAIVKLACGASPYCQWLDVAGACAVGSNLLPSLVLDPADRWVSALNNATSVCRALANASSCAAAPNVGSLLQGTGGGGGGAAGMTRVSWWALLGSALAAVGLMEASRRR